MLMGRILGMLAVAYGIELIRAPLHAIGLLQRLVDFASTAGAEARFE